MTNKPLSTFEREMQDPAFRKQFEEEYKEFLLSEIIRELMETSKKSVRKLASESGLSTTAIQNLRSGVQEDMKLTNFLNVSHACGYNIVLEKNGKKICL
ncbi:AsnC family protein [Legionella pneumophila serogroup 1]